MSNELIDRIIELISNRGDLKYYPSNDSFYMCNDGLWYKQENREVFQYIQEIEGTRFTKKVLQELLFQLTLTETLIIKEWPIVEGTAFRNGILVNGNMTPYKANSLIKSEVVLPYEYNDGITYPTIKEYLARIGKDSNNELVEFILDILYIIIFLPHHSFSFIINICGKGGSGKSVLVNLICYLVGINNIASGDGSNMSTRFYSAVLDKKKLLVLNDIVPSLSDRISGLLKNITGDDLILAEEKYKNPKTITSQAIVVITSNIPVSFKDNSSGVSRRLVYLLLDNKYEGNNELLIAMKGNIWVGSFINEIPGLIAYIYSSRSPDIVLSRLNSMDLAYNRLHSVAVDIINNNNPLVNWINTRLYISNSEILLKLLYLDYLDWCSENGYKIGNVSIYNFGQLLFQAIPYSYLKGVNLSKVRSKSGVKISGIAIG